MKTAIFDMDGTLLDSMWIWANIEHKIFELTNIRLTNAMMQEAFKTTLFDYMENLIMKNSIKFKSGEFTDIMVDYLITNYTKNTKIKPYVKEYLDQLKDTNIPMLVATATQDTIATHVLSELNLLPYFDQLYSSYSMPLSKGDSAFWDLVVKDIEAERKNIVLFDDAFYCLKGAKKAGLTVVGVEEAVQISDRDNIKQFADIYIESFKDFKYKLKK